MKETTTETAKETAKLERHKPHQKYSIDGVKVPGVTTILGIIDKSGPLIHWAWKLGTEGKDYRKVRDEAADTGTIAHFMSECYIKGKAADLNDYTPEEIEAADVCFQKFVEYWNREQLTLDASEAQLVSTAHRFGGTLDIVVLDNGFRRCLFDLKTSKAIYESYWWQLAAYKLLWEENHPDKPIERNIICRIGKEEAGDFEVLERTDLTKETDIFLKAKKLYNAVKGK